MRKVSKIVRYIVLGSDTHTHKWDAVIPLYYGDDVKVELQVWNEKRPPTALEACEMWRFYEKEK